jgi:hypothetical protein
MAMIESEDMTNMYLSIYSFIKRFMANRYIGHFMDKPTRYWVFYMLVAALDLNVINVKIKVALIQTG